MFWYMFEYFNMISFIFNTEREHGKVTQCISYFSFYLASLLVTLLFKILKQSISAYSIFRKANYH